MCLIYANALLQKNMVNRFLMIFDLRSRPPTVTSPRQKRVSDWSWSPGITSPGREDGHATHPLAVPRLRAGIWPLPCLRPAPHQTLKAALGPQAHPVGLQEEGMDGHALCPLSGLVGLQDEGGNGHALQAALGP